MNKKKLQIDFFKNIYCVEENRQMLMEVFSIPLLDGNPYKGRGVR